jgi:hypothetical protein
MDENKPQPLCECTLTPLPLNGDVDLVARDRGPLSTIRTFNITGLIDEQSKPEITTDESERITVSANGTAAQKTIPVFFTIDNGEHEGRREKIHINLTKITWASEAQKDGQIGCRVCVADECYSCYGEQAEALLKVIGQMRCPS